MAGAEGGRNKREADAKRKAQPMMREPHFCCAVCGRKFAESPALAYKCGASHDRDEARKQAAIDRRLGYRLEDDDDFGVRRTLAPWRGRWR
jgi:hypothetical protein